MNRTIRNVIFFFFVAGFAIGAPLIVLYTAGFRYNWQSGTLIRTGVLSVSSTPRNADILLDGQNINRQTPAVIKQLMPGQYDLTLARADYHPWRNTVTIGSNLTTHVPLIALWRESAAEAIETLPNDIKLQISKPSTFDETISFRNTGNQTELLETLNSNVKVVALLPKSQYEVQERDNQYLLLKNTEHDLLIIDLSATEPILFKQNVSVYDYLDDSQLLLWSDGYEINIYSPKDHRTEFITRQSETINQVRFWPDGNTILFTSQDKLLAIDRYKNGDERYLVTLITADSLHNFFLSSDGKTAYLEATIEGTDGFYSLRLR